MSYFDSLDQYSYDQIQATSDWWDTVWTSTFTGITPDSASLTMLHFVYVGRVIMVFILPFWLLTVARAAGLLGGQQGITNQFSDMARIFIASFFIFVMSANNGLMISNMAMQSRDLIHAIRNETYELQIASNTLHAAVDDAWRTTLATDQIYADAQECETMPHAPAPLPSLDPPEGTELTQSQQQLLAYFDCYRTLQARVEQSQQDAFSLCGPASNACESFSNMAGRIANSIGSSIQGEAEKILNGELPNLFAPFLGLNDIFLGAAAMAFVKPFLSVFQYVYVSVLELALWLAALIAPLAIAFSLIPGTFSLFAKWALTFFSIGLEQILYATLIGASALLLQKTTGAGITEVGFPLLLSLGAPIAAHKLVFGGARSVANAYAASAFGGAASGLSAVAALGTGGASVGASIGASAASSASKSASKASEEES